MKATRYLAIALAVIAILASLGWYLRNTLIQSISNPLLEQYDIAVTDVSLDTLATRNTRIGYLELMHTNGTVIAIESLSLPIVAAAGGKKTYRAGKVSVTTATHPGEAPLELADLIAQILSLPETLPATQILIDELDVAPYPTVRNLQWNLSENRQVFRATIDSVDVAATITRKDAANHELVLALPGAAAQPRHRISANVRHDDTGFIVDAAAPVDLPAWMPVVALTGSIPEDISLDSGSAELRFAVSVPDDPELSPSLTASIVPATSLRITYAPTGATENLVAVIESSEAFELYATFPDTEWSLQQKQAALLLTYNDWPDMPVVITGLSCRTGPVCTMNARTTMADAKLPIGDARRIEVSALDVRFASVATPALTDNRWQVTAKSIDARVAALAFSETVAINASVHLEEVVAGNSQQVVEMHANLRSPPIEAMLDQQVVSLPGLRGEVSLQGEKFVAELASAGLAQDGSIAVQHNLQSDRGELSISGASVSFAGKALSRRVEPWPHDFDLSSGNVDLDLDSRWGLADATTRLDGRAVIRIKDLAGFYTDTVFTGLTTQLDLSYDSESGFAAQPASITIALIEMGLPVEDVAADYTVDINERAVRIQKFGMTAFGGHVWADPFSFHTARSSNNLILRAESIELSRLLTTDEFAAVEVSGTISAQLPMTLEDDGIMIVDGKLTGEAPGGVIRYLPGGASDTADTSGLGLVNLALSNFQYESLTSDVNYSKNGELKLNMQLKGRNPDMQESRPVVLNLGVENNVRQMLKSLQAGRAVEDILQKRLQQ